MSVLEKLKQWQQSQARRESVETYRVLPYKTILELSQICPKNELDLLSVKGIGAIKVRRYGNELLKILRDEETSVKQDVSDDEDVTFSVTNFVNALNVLLSSHFTSTRVRGEVTDFRQTVTGHVYFQIKDESSVLRVTVFATAYRLSGLDLSDGDEVIVTGHPQHHEQYGFSFLGQTIEYAGEGLLKKAYEKLKRTLLDDGLFLDDKKRILPQFPRDIGLITSRDSAAIGDFMTNIGHYGFRIFLAHSAVEGQHAIHDLSMALKSMRKRALRGEIEVLVVVRGGGSLESLQAFNNEVIVRMIADFPVPVVAGIGHDRDETLVTLVADSGQSTPTGAAKILSSSWNDACGAIDQSERSIVDGYMRLLSDAKNTLREMPYTLTIHFHKMLSLFDIAERRLFRNFDNCHDSMDMQSRRLDQITKRIIVEQKRGIVMVLSKIEYASNLIDAHNPLKKLAQGYSIVRNDNGIVRSVDDIDIDDELSVQVSDGTIETVVVKK